MILIVMSPAMFSDWQGVGQNVARDIAPGRSDHPHHNHHHAHQHQSTWSLIYWFDFQEGGFQCHQACWPLVQANKVNFKEKWISGYFDHNCKSGSLILQELKNLGEFTSFPLSMSGRCRYFIIKSMQQSLFLIGPVFCLDAFLFPSNHLIFPFFLYVHTYVYTYRVFFSHWASP